MSASQSRSCFRLCAFALAASSLASSHPAFGAPGDKLGSEFRVNTLTSGSQRSPAVARSTNGDFVVAWADYSSSNAGIYYRRYKADGVAKDGSAVRVIAKAADRDSPVTPDVAMDEDGDFVVMWLDPTGSFNPDDYDDDPRILVRRYSASGSARDSSPREAARGSAYGNIESPSIAIDAAGNYAVAYSEHGFDGINGV